GVYVGCNRPPSFASFGQEGHAGTFAALNALPPAAGYVTQHLCPRDDHTYDPTVDRLFFTRHNGGQNDAKRERIRAWKSKKIISAAERSYLLATLIYATSYVSNTNNVFKSFHGNWGGATRTTLYRILAPIRLSPPLTLDNNQNNLVTALD